MKPSEEESMSEHTEGRTAKISLLFAVFIVWGIFLMWGVTR